MNHDPHDAPRDERAPYQSPRVLEDLPLETFSLACGKADACAEQGDTPQS